jgi:2,4-dienoyl-CoA reductase-like NADH-dependent reductase (Old Yellow Enzyme family)
VLAPSAIAYNDRHAQPKEMTKADIEDVKAAFVAAIKRAVSAGIDGIEIHNAHGYLLHEFLSPVSNQRTDEYGGSFDNRVRLTLEITELARATIPKDMPLFLRISATDWLEEDTPELDSWTLEQTVRLAPLLADRGLDFLDVSSGGLHEKQHIHGGPGYQVPFAQAIKKAVGDRLLVGAVGTITEAKQAESYLEAGLDAVIIGRNFLKNPGLVWQFAEELGVEAQWANQMRCKLNSSPLISLSVFLSMSLVLLRIGGHNFSGKNRTIFF